MRINLYLVAAAMIALSGLQQKVVAQIPGRISVQGVAMNDGKAVQGTLSCVMRIYDAPTGGNKVFEENKTITFDNGLFHAYLGEFIPIAGLHFDRPYWLAIHLADGELSPRIQMTTVPYAFMAGNVPDSSITYQKLSKRGGLPGQALVATDNGVAWQDVVNKIIGSPQFYLTPRDGTGNVKLALAFGSISGEYLMDNSITPIKLNTAGLMPQDGDILTFDASGGGRLEWAKASSGSGGFRLPFNANYDKPGDAFSINHLGNGSSGKFTIETAASNSPALYAESKGIASALFSQAAGSGYAAEFNSLAAAGTRSTVRVEHAATGAAIEARNISTSGNVATIRSTALSTGDSVTALSGSITANNPGLWASGISGVVRSSSARRGSGVWGHHAGRGAGVFGTALRGVGVIGRSTDSIGILGQHISLTGRLPGMAAVTLSKSDSASAFMASIVQDSAGINASAVVGINNTKTAQGNGIWGQHLGNGNAVYGSTVNGTGVHGHSANGIGVIGTHTSNTGMQAGLHGESFSSSDNASGAIGIIMATNAGVNAAGVRGNNMATNGNGAGVVGAHSGSGAGVHGISVSGVGVNGIASGTSATSIGVRGESTSPFGTGVSGTGQGRRSVGVSGSVTGDSAVAVRGISTNSSATSYAGYFDGKVNVKGELTKSYGAGTAGERNALPVCYGTVTANGLVLNGTPNFESAWSNAGYYTITLPGLIYSNAAYTTVVTPLGGGAPVFANANEFVGGILQIRVYNLMGNSVQNSFSFIVYKAQ